VTRVLLGASRQSWLRPADVLRRILDNVFRRRTVVPSSGEFGLLRAPGYTGQLAPDIEDAPRLLRARIDALASAQAIDEGTGRVLDPTINSWVDQWALRVEREHRANQSLLQLHVVEARAERDRVQAELNRVQAELDDVNCYLANRLEASGD
jgi:hypothetical protein